MRTSILFAALAVLVSACGPSVTLSTDSDHYLAGIENVILLLENDSAFEIQSGDLAGAKLERIAADGSATVIEQDTVDFLVVFQIASGSQVMKLMPLSDTLEAGEYRWRHAYGDAQDSTKTEVRSPPFQVDAAP